MLSSKIGAISIAFYKTINANQSVKKFVGPYVFVVRLNATIDAHGVSNTIKAIVCVIPKDKLPAKLASETEIIASHSQVVPAFGYLSGANVKPWYDESK